MAPLEKNPTEKGTDEARQGVTGTGARYVLAISLAAAFVWADRAGVLMACTLLGEGLW